MISIMFPYIILCTEYFATYDCFTSGRINASSGRTGKCVTAEVVHG